MLLCCFREQKDNDEAAKRRRKNQQRGGRHDEVDLAEVIATSTDKDVAILYAKTHSQIRPLKTPVSPVSLSSSTSYHGEEVLLAPVTYHGQPPQSSGGGRYQTRHSVSSYAGSDKSSRPPSREGSVVRNRDHKERAPLPREAKRLLKQRSQESFKDNNKSVTSIPYIDASPPTTTTASNGLVTVGSKALAAEVSPHHKGKPRTLF
jgi:hypothetical protein